MDFDGNIHEHLRCNNNVLYIYILQHSGLNVGNTVIILSVPLGVVITSIIGSLLFVRNS